MNTQIDKIIDGLPNLHHPDFTKCLYKAFEDFAASQFAASTNSGQGWISVEDKKPSDIEGYEEYDYFLCATEIGAIITGLCTYNEFTKQFYPATMSGYDDRIKFWQPLPEPPKQ